MIKNTNIWQNFIDISERAILMIIAVATLYATGIEIHRLIVEQVVTLSDLFLLFYICRSIRYGWFILCEQ